MTIQNKKKSISNSYSQHDDIGFTLVETMIAGLIMSIVLVAVSRFSISAIATSSHQSIRRNIEAAIDNDIQLIQKADSELKLIDIKDKTSACDDPGSYLMNKLLDSDLLPSEPYVQNLPNGISLSRTIQSSTDPILTTIAYAFTAPEKVIQTETRKLIIYPNFHYLCDVN